MALDRNESKKLRLEENIPEPISPIVSYGSVVLFSLLLILAGMNISSVAPFFPTEARERNISVPTTGIIVASLQISQGFFGFLFLFTVSDKQKIWFAYVGFVLSGLMCVIFSLSYHFNSKHLFVLWCSVTRILIGMGGACKWATSAPILIPLFPNKAGIIFSTLEVSANFGLMIGPPLSSWLYSLGGYKFPFIVMGATELFVGFLCFVATRSLQNRLPGQSSQQREEMEFSLKPALRFLSLPGVWAITLPFMVVLAQLGFLSVTLAPHLLDTFNIDGTKSGTIFLIHASMSTLTCFLYGYLLDKGYAKITFFICLALTSLGYFVLALPFVGFDHPKLTLYAGLSILGVSSNGGYLPCFFLFSEVGKRNKFAAEESLRICIFTWITASYSIAIVIGQYLVGGLFFSCFNFYQSSLLLSGVTFLLATVAGIYVAISDANYKGEYKPL